MSKQSRLLLLAPPPGEHVRYSRAMAGGIDQHMSPIDAARAVVTPARGYWERIVQLIALDIEMGRAELAYERTLP